ncbi:MAG: YfaZ family outer membrane protein [Motiliproteus sp.]
MIQHSVAKGLITGLGVALLSTSAAAGTFNLGINDDTLDVGLKASLSSTGQFSANYLYSETEGKTADLGFQTVHNAAGKQIALGVKLMKLWAERRDNGHAVALGGDFRMPVAPSITAAIAGYYAPTVLSSSGIENYYSIDAKLMYALMPTADLYVGYRDVHFKFDTERDLTFAQNFYLGAELKF